MESDGTQSSVNEQLREGAEPPASPVGLPAKPSPLNCPICGATMIPLQRWGRRVETCVQHGVWTDKNEIRQPLGWLRRANGACAVLCGLQVLGVSGAVVCAAYDIESIVITGPLFSVLGALVAVGSFASRSALNAIFGLSAGAMSLFCLVWIVSLSWSPDQAQKPVSTVLICYETLVLPLGLLALHRTIVPRLASATADARPLQFGIRHMLTITFVLAVMMAAGKLGFEHGDNVRLGIAVGLFAGSVIGIAFALYFGITSLRAVTRPERIG